MYPFSFVSGGSFITIVRNTTVNVAQLSPQNFESVAPPLKNKIFSQFGSSRLIFSFFIVLLMFGYPSGPECSIFDYLGCHVWSMLVPLLVFMFKGKKIKERRGT